jgi:hypothetical protein
MHDERSLEEALRESSALIAARLEDKGMSDGAECDRRMLDSRSEPVPLCNLDARGTIEEVNARGASLLGVAREVAVGCDLAGLAGLRDPDALRRHIREALLASEPVSSPLEVEGTTDGARGRFE